MMAEEREAEEAGVDTMSVSSSTEHTTSDKRTCSNVSVTIDQMVRDFIIAKTIGMNGSDSVKAEHDRKGHQKSNKDKKKKKKKKRKSHHKESSLKHHRHRHRGVRSPDASSESNPSVEGLQHCNSNVAEEKSAEADVKNDESKVNDGQVTSTKKNKECRETTCPTSEESVNSAADKETLLNVGVCSHCGKNVMVPDEQKAQTVEVQCHCVSPTKAHDKIVSKNETVFSRHKDDTASESNKRSHVSSDLQHTAEAICHLHKENTLSHRHSDEAKKSTKQEHEYGVSSKSKHNIDNSKMSDCFKHSSRERKHSRGGLGQDKPTSSGKSSPLLEKVSDRHSLLTNDDKSDDVVFVKKVCASDSSKSSLSRETVSNREKSERQQKLSRRSTGSRSIAVGDNGKHGSKHKYESRSSAEDDSVPKCKVKKDRRQTKDSPVILLSDDDVDVLSDEMMEKLHKRLTSSIKKSKELQAERELNLAANSKTDDAGTGYSTELTEDGMCCDVGHTQNFVASTSPSSEVILRADSAVVTDSSHGESASTGEPSAVKVTTSGLFGKKTLKFGLKISESSAAWISQGLQSSHATGNLQPLLIF